MGCLYIHTDISIYIFWNTNRREKKMAAGKERKKARGFDDCYPFSYPFAILFKLHFEGKHE